jgi:hypothetical protein
MVKKIGPQIDRSYAAGKTISAIECSKFVGLGVKQWGTSYPTIIRHLIGIRE